MFKNNVLLFTSPACNVKKTDSDINKLQDDKYIIFQAKYFIFFSLKRRKKVAN